MSSHNNVHSFFHVGETPLEKHARTRTQQCLRVETNCIVVVVIAVTVVVATVAGNFHRIFLLALTSYHHLAVHLIFVIYVYGDGDDDDGGCLATCHTTRGLSA